MAQVHRQLAEDPETLVEVTDVPDIVCGACPHRQPAGCTLNGEYSEDQMRAQDHHVLGLLGLQCGAQVHWREILDRIRASVKGRDLPDICGQCRWLPLGYCAEGIDGLQEEPLQPRKVSL
jgi:hypothetical protein